MSNMRMMGVLIGILILFAVFLQLRKRREERISLVLPILIGVGVICVSLVPELAELPANVLALGTLPGGRLLSILILSSCVLWLFLLWERAKLAKNRAQLLKMAMAVSFDRFSSDFSLPPNSIWVVIPVLNEAENLRELLPQIPRTISGKPVLVLVMDDGSTDDSVAVAREHKCLTASLLVNFGGGLALKTGFEIATRHGAEAIVTIDGDCQHQPSDIEEVVKPVLEGDADLVIGSRYLGEYERVSYIRSVGLRVFNQLINRIQGIRITDCSSGFRAIRVKELMNWRLEQEQYHTAEMIIEAAKGQSKIQEVPITVRLRAHGESKKGKDILYGVFFLRTIMKTWLR